MRYDGRILLVLYWYCLTGNVTVGEYLLAICLHCLKRASIEPLSSGSDLPEFFSALAEFRQPIDATDALRHVEDC